MSNSSVYVEKYIMQNHGWKIEAKKIIEIQDLMDKGFFGAPYPLAKWMNVESFQKIQEKWIYNSFWIEIHHRFIWNRKWTSLVLL